MQPSRILICLTVISLLAGTASAQTHSDWPTFGGQAGGGQYSSLDQINASNVERRVFKSDINGNTVAIDADTSMANGQQYIVIAAGGNRRTFTKEGDAIVAYRLQKD